MKRVLLILMMTLSTVHAKDIDDGNITANPEVFLPIVIGTGIVAVGTVLDLAAMKLVLNPRAGFATILTTAVIGTGLMVSGVGIVAGGVGTGLIEWAEGE